MALTEGQKADFFREGYIVVRDLLTENELATLRERYTALVTGQVATYPSKHVSVREVEGRAAHGKAHRPPDREASIRQGPHHDRRGTQVYPRGEDDFVDQRQTPVENPIDAVTKVNLPSRYDNAFEEIVRSPKVVDVIEDLIA